jgi:hypothetical protein
MQDININVSKYLNLMKPVIHTFSDGNFFRLFFSILLKVMGVLFFLDAFVIWIKVLRIVFDAFDYAPLLAFGGILFLAILLVTVIAAVQVIFIRAQHIKELTGNDFIILPIIAVSFRLLGELLTTILVGLTLGSTILVWFGGSEAAAFLTRAGLSDVAPFVLKFASYSFIIGILWLILGLICAFLFLAFFYAAAESVIVFVDIARNTKKTSLLVEAGPAGATAGAGASGPFAVSSTAPPQTTTCPKCNASYDGNHHGEFCDQCGTKM